MKHGILLSSPNLRRSLIISSSVLGIILLAVIGLLAFIILQRNERNTMSSGDENGTVTFTQTISAESGGVIEHGAFSLNIAPNVLAQNSNIHISTIAAEKSPHFQAMVGRVAALGMAYNLTTENPVFDGQLDLTLPYDPALLPVDFDERSIVVSYYDEEFQQWISLPSEVDTQAHTVSTTIDHFSWYVPSTWFSGNKPPKIIDFYFSPAVYSIDCKAFKKAPETWLKDHPYKVVLHVSDPDGLDDIQDPPQIVFRADHYLKMDRDSDAYPMRQTGTPGEYIFESNFLINDVRAGSWSILLAQVLADACGDLQTMIARVLVRDKPGNMTKFSTFQDVRYFPVPEIFLKTPIANEMTSLIPLLEWDFGNTMVPGDTYGSTIYTLGKFRSIDLDVSKKSILWVSVIYQSFPISQRSFQIPNGILKPGERYYWRLTLNTSGGGTISSQVESFTTSNYWSDLTVNDFLVEREAVDHSAKSLTWVVMQGSETRLKREAQNETILDLRSIYGPQMSGEKYTVWLEAFYNNKYNRISNIVNVSFENDTSYQSVLNVQGDLVQRTPVTPTDANLNWVVTRSNKRILERKANNELTLDLPSILGPDLTEGDYFIWVEADYKNQKVPISNTATLTIGVSNSVPPPGYDHPLTLDRNYMCNEGPGENYPPVTSFFAGDILQVVGTDGHGWWEVAVELQRVPTCWIGGGAVAGDVQEITIVQVPPPPATTDLVDVTVSQREVDLVFRDNASIDGDRIRVYLNGVMILDDYTLTGEGYYLPVVLNQGSNEVIIEALNEGEESPNTVEVSMTFVIEGPEVQIAKGLTTGQTISFFVIAP